jgi:hypothetical protein
MKKIIWKLFPPREVQFTCVELEKLLTNLARPIRRYIQPAIKNELDDISRIVCSIRIDGMKPDELALLILYNITFLEISYGNHHSYRAVLNDAGGELHRFWKFISQESLKKGYIQQSEFAEFNQQLESNIKNAG